MTSRPLRALALATVVAASLTGCGSDDEAYPPIANSPWVRTTDGATNTMMTAMFMDLANPGPKDITLTEADCSSVAGKTEIHEMVKKDGKMVMREKQGGFVVPKESHLHMAPGGPHIMLMKLKKKLPVGEQVTCTLHFDTGETLEVKANVKKFTEEDETYDGHTHEA